MKSFMRFPNGKAKAVTLSFDDGVKADIRLVEKLKELGMRATFNLNSGFMGDPDRKDETGNNILSKEECIELYKHPNFEVASHAKNHAHLGRIPVFEIVSEIIEDRRELEKMFGVPIRGFAYPYGVFTTETEAAARLCGIAYSRTCSSHHDFLLPSDWLAWGPTCHYCERDIPELLERFNALAPEHDPKLFYLWAHSYECDLNDNWDALFDYLEKLSGHDDIWYATNLEICDYVHAFEQLRFSVDESIVQNPTALSVWIAKDGTIYEIKPNETIKI
ncbi:MAG: polysaccharide deacetylase family protein [Clostridia bacterium]|nr:polysaccharide deacetylase family protein [Clostridia bacterium]